jgi:hypothetical protein
LKILSIFVKQRTYLATLPDRSPHEGKPAETGDDGNR